MTTQIFRIVFEDEKILVVEKLRPFISQKADERAGEGLYEFVSRTIGKPLFPVHRLDRDVLGLMIFGKTRQAAERLSDQFKDRVVQKRYETEVWGKVRNDEGVLVHYLKKNAKTNYVTVFPRETVGAKRAELSYRVLSRSDKTTKLLIQLKTGRSHQIRVQLAKIGHPIVGDTKYSKKSAEDRVIQLRSVYLAIHHPDSDELLEWDISASASAR
jgi:23S rRNA pseudouridine1911/1915/1917 synthase